MRFDIVKNQIMVGKATKEELIRRYGCSESTLYRILEQGGEEKKLLLAQMRANKKADRIYLDVSYLRAFGLMTAVMRNVGRGRVYATGLRNFINVNDIDLKGLYQDKNFTIVCGSEAKAFMYEQAGFKHVLTYVKRKKKYWKKEEA